jgi:thymidylate synthase
MSIDEELQHAVKDIPVVGIRNDFRRNSPLIECREIRIIGANSHEQWRWPPKNVEQRKEHIRIMRSIIKRAMALSNYPWSRRVTWHNRNLNSCIQFAHVFMSTRKDDNSPILELFVYFRSFDVEGEGHDDIVFVGTLAERIADELGLKSYRYELYAALPHIYIIDPETEVEKLNDFANTTPFNLDEVKSMSVDFGEHQ